MASIAWPAQLTGLRYGWREKFQSNRVDTRTDSGPGKSRRRYTDAPRIFSVTYLMNETECAIFDLFFHNTTAGGSLRFDYVHPRVGNTFEVRFDGEPPEPVEVAEGLYSVSFRLKTLGADV